MGKRRYITFKVDEEIEEAAAIHAQRPAREPLAEQCSRCMRFAGFFIVCSSTVFQALAPWMLSVIEVGALLLLYLLLLWPQQPPGPYQFSFSGSTEDLLLLGGCRAAALCGTYAYGSSYFKLWPYLYTSYVVGAGGFLYALVKGYCFKYPANWLPPASMLLTFTVFSWLHILAARQTLVWARRQGLLGLAPVTTHRQTARPGPGADLNTALLSTSDVDLPPEALADPDSQFVDVGGIRIHYQEARPATAADAQDILPQQMYTPQSMSRSKLHGAALAGSVPPPWAEERGAQLQEQQQQQQLVREATAQHSARVGAWMPEVSAETEPADQNSPAAAPVATLEGSSSAAAGLMTGCDLQPGGTEAAVLLIHGFGGGTFAWRHIMQPLATAAGVRVVAFDRPGFGLTSCPGEEATATAPTSDSAYSMQQQQQHAPRYQDSPGAHDTTDQQQHVRIDLPEGQQQQQQRGSLLNPYTIEAQAHLTLRFCAALGLRNVVLVGHADGCLVAVHAAAAATRSACSHAQQQQQDTCSSKSREGSGLGPAEVCIHVKPEGQCGAAGVSCMQTEQQQQASSSSNPALVPSTLLQMQHNPTSMENWKSLGAFDAASCTSSISFRSMLLNGSNSNSQPLLVDGTGSQECLLCLEEQADDSNAVLTPSPPAAAAAARSDVVPEQGSSVAAINTLQQQQQQPGFSITGSSSTGSTSLSSTQRAVNVCGVVLLHPNLSGHRVPPFMRLLAGSSLGRSMLRPLLRSEVGEVTNRRAWHNPDLVTREVRALYKRPLRVQGWDTALLAASRAAGSLSSRQVAAQLAAVRHMPVLIATGAQDRIATPAKVSAVATLLGQSQIATIPACGHLSHEEAPQRLLQLLVPFCTGCLA